MAAARESGRRRASSPACSGRGQESTAMSLDLGGGEPKPEPIDLQVLLTPADFAHNSGRRGPRFKSGRPIETCHLQVFADGGFDRDSIPIESRYRAGTWRA